MGGNKRAMSTTKAVVKFLNDGRKVVVIGQLNNHEHIVQEIFCTEDGSEIPSGERFVVKSLHDKPVQSYAEKRIAEHEATLKRLDGEVDRASSRLREAQDIAKAKIRSLRAIASEAVADSLDELEMFVSGEIKYLLQVSYGRCRISAVDDALTDRDSRNSRFDGLKLLSLFGSADGTLQWRIHQYSDHFGSSYHVYFATSIQDAVAQAQALYDESVEAWRDGDATTPPSLDWLRGNVESIDIPNDVRQWYSDKRESERKAKITKLEAELETLKEKP